MVVLLPEVTRRYWIRSCTHTHAPWHAHDHEHVRCNSRYRYYISHLSGLTNKTTCRNSLFENQGGTAGGKLIAALGRSEPLAPRIRVWPHPPRERVRSLVRRARRPCLGRRRPMQREAEQSSGCNRGGRRRIGKTRGEVARQVSSPTLS